MKPLPQQLDIDGGLHDLAPDHEKLKLFEPAPRQIEGQTFIQTDEPTGETES